MQHITDKTYYSLKKKVPIKVVHEPLLDEFEREGAACNYYRASGWGMLPDVASIRNQDVSAAALMHAHIRTHADALGATIPKCCKPEGVAERCPTCGDAASENFAHSAFVCRHPGARALSHSHETKIASYMKALSPGWTGEYESSTTRPLDKARLILNAANFLENDRIDSQHDSRVRGAVRLVGCWLEDLRDSHPQYRRYARSMNIHSLTYYARPEPSSSTSGDTSSTESD